MNWYKNIKIAKNMEEIKLNNQEKKIFDLISQSRAYFKLPTDVLKEIDEGIYDAKFSK